MLGNSPLIRSNSLLIRESNKSPWHRHALHFLHCKQYDTSKFRRQLCTPLRVRFRHFSYSFRMYSFAFHFELPLLREFILSFLVQQHSHTIWSWRRLSASSTLSCSHTTSHHIARHRKALQRAQLLSGSIKSLGSCTEHWYNMRATSAKVHASAHAPRSRYPSAHLPSLLSLLAPYPPAPNMADLLGSLLRRPRAARR